MSVGDGWLEELGARIARLDGVVGVVLGGSRARGDHRPDSDYDLGIYYRRPVDLAGLGEIARDVGGASARVTELGEWGPWVDGGAWLTVQDGDAVDLLYRDLGRVESAWAAAEQGRYAFHAQAGHPLGVPDFAYPGELALAVVLADPTGELAALQGRVRGYPPALRERLVAGLWEADFLVGVARKAVARGDSAYVAGCLFRLVGVCVHALHGAAGKWLINEKGAVASAAQLPGAPERLAERVDLAFGAVAGDPLRLALTLDVAADLVLDTVDACTVMMR